MKFSRNTAALMVAASFAVAGCEKAAPPTVPPPVTTAKDDHGHDHAAGGHEHGGHGAGPHDGTLADWGGGKYHVEFTVDHDKKESTVYVLGGDEKTPAPVKTTDGSLLLTITEPAFQVTLKASPLEGEADGASSRYVGQHDSLGIVREFSGSISGEVGGTPYAGDFKEEPHDHK
jgi:hypothetical protein